MREVRKKMDVDSGLLEFAKAKHIQLKAVTFRYGGRKRRKMANEI